MTRIFTDGAEFQDLLLFSVTTTTGVGTSIKRSGVASYIVNGGGTATIPISELLELYFRVGIYFDSNATNLFQLRNGATVIGEIKRNNITGNIEIYVGASLVATGDISTTINTWYLIEVHLYVHDTLGEFSVRIDGVNDATFSGDTKPSTQTTVDNIYFRGPGGTDNNYFDDLALNDTNGSDDNSWCDDGKVAILTTNADGDVSGLTGQDADSVNNYLNVDDIPKDDDTTYNEASVSGTYDLYNTTSGTFTTDSIILRVFPEGRARDTVAAGGIGALGIKPLGGSEFWATGTPLLTSYTRIIGNEYLINPTSSGTWEIADIDELQTGFKVGV